VQVLCELHAAKVDKSEKKLHRRAATKGDFSSYKNVWFMFDAANFKKKTEILLSAFDI